MGRFSSSIFAIAADAAESDRVVFGGVDNVELVQVGVGVVCRGWFKELIGMI